MCVLPPDGLPSSTGACWRSDRCACLRPVWDRFLSAAGAPWAWRWNPEGDSRVSDQFPLSCVSAKKCVIGSSFVCISKRAGRSRVQALTAFTYSSAFQRSDPSIARIESLRTRPFRSAGLPGATWSITMPCPAYSLKDSTGFPPLNRTRRPIRLWAYPLRAPLPVVPSALWSRQSLPSPDDFSVDFDVWLKTGDDRSEISDRPDGALYTQDEIPFVGLRNLNV